MTRGSALTAAALVVAALWLGYLAAQRPYTLAGDPFGVYFPTVQSIHAGEGAAALAPLRRGSLRMPVYPAALAVAATVEPDLTRAAQGLGMLSALATLLALAAILRRAGGPPWIAAPAALAVVAAPTFARAALEALPDMLALALLTWTGVLLLRSPGRGPRLVAGLLAGLGFSTRANLVVLLLIGLGAVWADRRAGRRGHGGAFVAGFGLGALPVGLTAAALARIGLSYPYFSLAASRTAGGEGGAGGAILSGLLATPIRFGTAAGLGLALVGLAALLERLARRRLDPVTSGGGAVAMVMAAPLAVMHFEARYYLFALPCLALFAGAAAAPSFGGRLRAPLVGAALLLAAGLGASETVPALTEEGAKGDAWAQACLRASGDRPRLVGLRAGRERWSALRMCPRPHRDRRIYDLRLVDASSAALGLDAFAASDADVTPAPPLPPAVSGTVAATAETLTLRYPHRLRRRCVHRTLEARPGRYAFTAALELPPPLLAEVVVASGPRRIPLWRADSGPVTSPTFRVGPGAVTVSLCSVDENIGPGAARLVGASLIARP